MEGRTYCEQKCDMKNSDQNCDENHSGTQEFLLFSAEIPLWNAENKIVQTIRDEEALANTGWQLVAKLQRRPDWIWPLWCRMEPPRQRSVAYKKRLNSMVFGRYNELVSKGYDGLYKQTYNWGAHPVCISKYYIYTNNMFFSSLLLQNNQSARPAAMVAQRELHWRLWQPEMMISWNVAEKVQTSSIKSQCCFDLAALVKLQKVLDSKNDTQVADSPKLSCGWFTRLLGRTGVTSKMRQSYFRLRV